MLRYTNEYEKLWIQWGSSHREKSLNVWCAYNLLQIKFLLSNMTIHWMSKDSHTMAGFLRVFRMFWALLYSLVKYVTLYDSRLLVLMSAFEIGGKLYNFLPESRNTHSMHFCSEMRFLLMFEKSDFPNSSYTAVFSCQS